MRPESISLILAGFIVKGLLATPLSASQNSDLVVTHAEGGKTDGVLLYYGVSSGDKSRRSLDNQGNLGKHLFWNSPPPPCVTDAQPECDDDNGAPNDVCARLLDNLFAFSDRKIPKSDRQICYIGDAGGKCCLKWTQDIEDLHNGDLTPFAKQSKQSFPTARCSQQLEGELLNTNVQYLHRV
jgi:hypothetical protein